MEFYPQPNRYLFGGIFKIISRNADKYAVESVTDYEQFEGRVLVPFVRYQGLRGRGFYLENHYDQLEIAEIFPARYEGEEFCGFNNINHSFSLIETIVKTSRRDWMAALSSIKGIYMIMDISNGKKYIGSAYSEGGIWSRWACYISNGHGWNDELTRLITSNGIDYARKNFVFSIIEATGSAMPNEYIIARESHWKKVLLTREFGYNKN